MAYAQIVCLVHYTVAVLIQQNFSKSIKENSIKSQVCFSGWSCVLSNEMFLCVKFKSKSEVELN